MSRTPSAGEPQPSRTAVMLAVLTAVMLLFPHRGPRRRIERSGGMRARPWWARVLRQEQPS